VCVTAAKSSTARGSCSVAEYAAYVIANGSISLDAKLGIFTVRGTVEPRLIQLFPKLSCSCPAADGCYHIAAAKQAIGMRDDVQQRIAAPVMYPSVASAATGHVDDDVEPDDNPDDAVIIRDDISTHATVLILLLAKTERSTR